MSYLIIRSSFRQQQSAGPNNTDVLVRLNIRVPEENGLLEQLKELDQLTNYGHRKKRSDGLVMVVTQREE